MSSDADIWQDEGGEGLEIGVETIDFGFEPLDLRCRDAERIRALAGRAEIGAEVEKIVLDARQHLVHLTLGMEPSQADSGVGLVDRAISGDAEIVLGEAGPIAKRGLALIAAAGVDLGELDHRCLGGRETQATRHRK